VDDVPVYYGEYNMPKDASMVLGLNNVATGVLTQKGNNSGVALILRLPKN